MSIFIFSRAVRTGKTTELQNWCMQQKNVCGVLMPDENEKRKIVDISTKNTFDIECDDAANTTEELVKAGKFYFYQSAFDKANIILEQALYKNPSWVIIDEIGKLELLKKGFYPSLKKMITAYAEKKLTGNLLLVVRDSLVNEVIEFLGIKNYTLVNELTSIY